MTEPTATKYTPGPWWSQGVWVVPADETRYTICQAQYGGAISFQEAKANARLMAAAPELLQWLRKFYETGIEVADFELVEKLLARVDGADVQEEAPSNVGNGLTGKHKGRD